MSKQERIDDGGPAFGRSVLKQEGTVDVDKWLGLKDDGHDGMSLRDYFAAKALIMHGIGLSQSEFPDWHMEVAQLSYKTADAMIRARKAGQ